MKVHDKPLRTIAGKRILTGLVRLNHGSGNFVWIRGCCRRNGTQFIFADCLTFSIKLIKHIKQICVTVMI